MKEFELMSLQEIICKIEELRYHKRTFRNFVTVGDVRDGYTIENINKQLKHFENLRKLKLASAD